MIILTFCLLRSGRLFCFNRAASFHFRPLCKALYQNLSQAASGVVRMWLRKKRKKETKKAQADINIYSSSKEREQHVKFGGFFTLYQGKKRTTPVSYI